MMHSGSSYDVDSPIMFAGTHAKVFYSSGRIGNVDRWLLVTPMKLAGRPERRIPIDPDRTVCEWLARIRQRFVGLAAEGKIDDLVHSDEEVYPRQPNRGRQPCLDLQGELG